MKRFLDFQVLLNDKNEKVDILSDTALMTNVQGGQLDALGLLYERYKKVLYAYFYNVIGHTANSEDLVQTVFFRILKYKHQYKAQGAFKSWMFTIARNALIDKMRKKSSGSFYSLENYKGKADDEIRRHEDQKLLKEALGRLDQETRELIVLVKLNEMKYREVAELTGMNESTIKVKVFRGIKSLKSLYETHKN